MARTDTREDFPLLASGITYLDNAATTQKPSVVLEAQQRYYEHFNANVHRGIYRLAEESTSAYEAARHQVAKQLGCKDDEVVFTSGTTHALNLAAHILESNVGSGDEILVTVADHHSCFVPFQQLAKRVGAKFVVVPLTDGTITEAAINALVTDKTKIIALAQTSNVLGYTLYIDKIKKRQAVLVVDAAQALAHSSAQLGNADFLAVSAHKAYGPMGIGALAGKKKLLTSGEPLMYGGSMIQRVTINDSTWADLPARFEAGTPNVAGAVGFAAALEYLKEHRDDKQELALAQKAYDIISKYAIVYGPKKRTAPIVSFSMKGVHAHDVAQILDHEGICVRAGQHCCEPLHDALGVSATVRVSLALYNTEDDIARLEKGLQQVRKVFP